MELLAANKRVIKEGMQLNSFNNVFVLVVKKSILPFTKNFCHEKSYRSCIVMYLFSNIIGWYKP